MNYVHLQKGIPFLPAWFCCPRRIPSGMLLEHLHKEFSMKFATCLLMPALACTLAAQGIFTPADKADSPICSRILRENLPMQSGSAAAATTGGNAGANYSHVFYNQKGDHHFPLGARKSVQAFGVSDEAGRMTTIQQLKGKVVIVGFWSGKCEPSAKMVMELADLYPKREKFGFEVLCVNFDENSPQEGYIGGWKAVKKFQQQNAAFFKTSKLPVYIPGIGAQGPSNFMDMVYSLPLLCVIDREGNLASMTIGYTPNFVVDSLKRVLAERPPVTPAASTAH